MRLTTCVLSSLISFPSQPGFLSADFIIPLKAPRFLFWWIQTIWKTRVKYPFWIRGQRERLDHIRDIKSNIFFLNWWWEEWEMIHPPSLPSSPIGCERCGLLSYKGGDRKHSACYLLQSHWQTEPFLPPSSSLVSSPDSWTFPGIVAWRTWQLCKGVDTVEMCWID